MTDTTRDLIQRMAKELDQYRQYLMDDRRETHALANEARAHLAQSEPEEPTDEELWDLYQDLGRDFSPTWFARAVLARWGRPAVQPVPVSERPWEREGWCDAKGMCWWWNPATSTLGTPWWSYSPWEWMEDATYSLPHHALTVPATPTETNGKA